MLNRWSRGDAADDCGQLEWADGLALDVRCGTGAGAGVSGPDVFVPESPRWLMKAGKPERARAALERIGSADYADRILREIAHTTERITIKSPMARCWLPR